MALPDSMSTLKTILYNMPSEELSSDGITTQILNDEQRRIRSSGLEVTTFYSKAGKTGKQKAKSDEKQKEHCTHCNIRGHDVSECRRLKKEQEANLSPGGKKYKALPSSANIADTGSDSGNESDQDNVVHILRGTVTETSGKTSFASEC